ncbi:hypothetical protein A2524_03290 [Candidatus Wolfebacteria bacterium RIFOXYD12_FULL_48_21]|uniref:Uncharacterized protein n=1 Tax=Candidatus Wolfebacteria bacterium RIFOXYD1_FULL_48_65 TaxID=1802561 RepID=A0A1F8E3Z6_9BACT|nr:MAG: hypothetical protein A2524_03290 [Candidatus Wolfebacteria bacterium RIFOXYD12_FULL_48_21]OGM95566.1 MAG: hypothetical protein A2610_01705 [Candidatus Wolfebacteria bacterium RIFOXYD1_FULL_48_65]OGM97847.1 MAG: hypothetical protein A2532_04740 [Candidatus Wolfebacteria bacterium RIFOXYD2_FULL_48_11]
MNTNIKLGLQLFAIATMSVGIALVAREGLAWTSPTSNPPLGSGTLKASGGNIGIGTAAPQGILHVSASLAPKIIFNDADGGGSGDLSLVFANAGTEKYYLSNKDGIDFLISRTGTNSDFYMKAGNVGIGTTNPTQGMLQINKASTYSTENTAGIALYSASTDSELLLGADATNDIAYIQSAQQGTSFSTRPLAINAMGGNVGIGTATPGYRLDVNGTAKATQINSGNYCDINGSSCKTITQMGAITDTWGSCYNVDASSRATCSNGYYLSMMDRVNCPGPTCIATCCRVR